MAIYTETMSEPKSGFWGVFGNGSNGNYEARAKLNAIGKSQAMIEFNMDGTIVWANDNFLNVLDYSLDEIKGQHHRIFCEQSYARSEEYNEFWRKLNRGVFDAGEYKRIGRGGKKEVWIQATYNPILDSDGKPFKVVKFATDVTEQKLKNADFEGKIDAIGKSQAMIEFNMDGTIVWANDNFLNVLDYSLDEIKGQHHRIFCEQSYARSEEYNEFWRKLNRGVFDAGEYKRIGKGGEERGLDSGDLQSHFGFRRQTLQGREVCYRHNR